MKKGMITLMVIGIIFAGVAMGADDKGFVTIHDNWGSTTYYTPGNFNTDIYVQNDYWGNTYVETYTQTYDPYYCSPGYVEVVSYPQTTYTTSYYNAYQPVQYVETYPSYGTCCDYGPTYMGY